jgi:hypothetical protein
MKRRPVGWMSSTVRFVNFRIGIVLLSGRHRVATVKEIGGISRQQL